MSWRRLARTLQRCRAAFAAPGARVAVLALALPSCAVGSTDVHPLQFVIGDFADERQVPVALLTRVTIDGRPCSVQVDTGVSRAFVLQQSSDEPANSWIDVELGALKARYPVPEAVKRRLSACRLDEPVASLGNAFFNQRTVVLDFASRSLTVHDAPLLRTDPKAQSFRFPGWQQQDGGVILVQVAGARQLPSEAMLDTGALRVDLGVLDPDTWRALADDEASLPMAFTLPSWGRLLQCRKIVARRPLVVATLPAARPVLTFCPDLAFRPAEPILGILGMRQFLHGGLIVDFISLRWRAL